MCIRDRADGALMAEAWSRGLTALRGAQAPALEAAIRVYVQTDVPTDMVSEAGPTGAQVAGLFSGFADAEIVMLDDLLGLDWAAVPRDGRRTIVASTHRMRYGANAGQWRPDLHLVLWNPFQALDVQGPTVVSWGYADGALAALKSWLQGELAVTATSPVSLG